MPGASSMPSTVAHSLSEKQFQTQVLDLAALMGWTTAHFHDSRREVRPGVHVGDRAAAGFPDVVLARPPKLLVVELKAEKGRVSDAQRGWLQLLERCGVDVRVWRPSSWPEIEETLNSG